MAHYAILCPHNAGHLLPLGALGCELVRRGHRVTVVNTAPAAPIAERFGLSFYEWTTDGIRGPSNWLIWKLFCQVNAGWMIGLREGYSRQAKILLKLAPAALKKLHVDGVVIDQTFIGGGTVAEHLGLPYVHICTALPWNEDAMLPPLFTHWLPAENAVARLRNRLAFAGWRWYMRPSVRLVNRYRKAWGLRPIRRVDDEYSPLAQICQLCRELDFPRHDPPSVLHYAGPLAANRPGRPVEFPWDRLDGRPMIFASLGTVPDPMNMPIYRKILDACAQVDAQLVLALGQWTDHEGPPVREQLGSLVGNPLVVDYAPQMALLEKASLMITHAGQNSAMEALSRGVPMVAVPRSADQPGVAARVEYAGAGLRAFFRTVTPEQLAATIRRVMTEPSFREQAGRLQRALVRSGGAPKAAEIVERALTTGRPVLAPA
ncbi:MAG: glycosyltransferase [Thermoguttaceae bacterium]